MVFVQQGFSSNLLVFNSSYLEWLYHGQWETIPPLCSVHYSRMESTACCGARCTFHQLKRQCVLRVPLHFHKLKGCCVAGPAALFTNRKSNVLDVPLHSSQMERTVCCGSLCAFHKRKGQSAAGPTALFTQGKDCVLRVPLHYSQTARTVCCGVHGSIHKRKGQCVAGPRLYSQIERTVCCGSLLPRATWTGPSLTSLKMAMASWWVRPATDRPFTENISSPKQGKC